MIKTKTCTRCLKRKSISGFYKFQMAGRTYLKSECKSCSGKLFKEWAKGKGKEYMREYKRAWNLENADHVRGLYLKAYYRNRKSILKRREKYRSENKVKINARSTARYNLIESKPCVVCGLKKTHRHHENYSEPLNVKWLCARHHMNLHHGNIHL